MGAKAISFNLFSNYFLGSAVPVPAMVYQLPMSSNYNVFSALGKQRPPKDLPITSHSGCKVKLCGIYYLTDGLDVLYVGKSTNVRARVKAHGAGDIDFSQVFVDECEPCD